VWLASMLLGGAGLALFTLPFLG